MNRKQINLIKFLIYREFGIIDKHFYKKYYILLPRNYDNHKFYFDQL